METYKLQTNLATAGAGKVIITSLLTNCFKYVCPLLATSDSMKVIYSSSGWMSDFFDDQGISMFRKYLGGDKTGTSGRFMSSLQIFDFSLLNSYNYRGFLEKHHNLAGRQ